MAKWDWLDFASGLAETGLEAYKVGANIRTAREAAEQKRVDEMLAGGGRRGYDAEFARRRVNEIDRVAPESATDLYSPDVDYTGGAPTPELGLPSIMEQAEPFRFYEDPGVREPGPRIVSLMDAKEAEDRRRAAGLYAFSDDAKAALSRIPERRRQIYEQESQMQEAERKNTGIKEQANIYHDNNLIVEQIERRLEQLEAERQSTKNANRLDAIKNEALSLITKQETAGDKVREAMAALKRMGVTEDRLKLIQKSDTYDTGLQDIMEGTTGASRTRAPGARSR